MGRKNLIRNNIYPYHVCTRSNNREWFPLKTDFIWNLALQALDQAYQKHPFQLHSFVVMGNHYHLLLTTPDSNLDSIMYEFNKNFSKALRTSTGDINRMFGGRYKWNLVSNERYLLFVTKYIYQNPCRAGLTNQCELYPYSTLFQITNLGPFPIPISPIGSLTKECQSSREFLNWTNNLYSKDQLRAIKTGLRKSEFSPGTRSPMKPICFDDYWESNSVNHQ